MYLKRKYTCKKTTLFPYLVVAPVVILILIFRIYPIILNIRDSFFYKDQLSLNNYIRIFTDKRIWESLWLTFKFTIILDPIQMVIAFGMALLASLNIKGVGVFRTIYYLPVTISMAVACIMWSMMFNPEYGVINAFLTSLGFDEQLFLVNEKQALGCIMLVCIWKGCGYLMMFFVAGIKDIDSALYESAKIDGASYWQSVFRVTLPSLKNTLSFVVITNTISCLLLFAPIYQMTEGGPQRSTNLLMYEVYKSAFVYGDRSRASALMTVLLVVVGLVVSVQFKFFNKED